MSLNTLIEAANFVEWANNSSPVPRVENAEEFHTYTKSADKLSDAESPPCEFKRRPGGAGTREVHNKLEKNRRAHLKDCFDSLKKQLPNLEDVKKISNLSILRNALRHIQHIQRREREMKLEMQRLSARKVANLQRVGQLQKDLTDMNIDISKTALMSLCNRDDEDETGSTSTATADNDSPIVSDAEDMDQNDIPPSAHPDVNQIKLEPSTIYVEVAQNSDRGKVSPGKRPRHSPKYDVSLIKSPLKEMEVTLSMTEQKPHTVVSPVKTVAMVMDQIPAVSKHAVANNNNTVLLSPTSVKPELVTVQATPSVGTTVTTTPGTNGASIPVACYTLPAHALLTSNLNIATTTSEQKPATYSQVAGDINKSTISTEAKSIAGGGLTSSVAASSTGVATSVPVVTPASVDLSSIILQAAEANKPNTILPVVTRTDTQAAVGTSTTLNAATIQQLLNSSAGLQAGNPTGLTLQNIQSPLAAQKLNLNISKANTATVPLLTFVTPSSTSSFQLMNNISLMPGKALLMSSTQPGATNVVNITPSLVAKSLSMNQATMTTPTPLSIVQAGQLPMTTQASPRPPVSQLLHQTITQRALQNKLQQQLLLYQQQQQQQQQQQLLAQQSAAQVTTVQSTPIRVSTAPQAGLATLRPAAPQTVSLAQLRSAIPINQMLPSLLGTSLITTAPTIAGNLGQQQQNNMNNPTSAVAAITKLVSDVTGGKPVSGTNIAVQPTATVAQPQQQLLTTGLTLPLLNAMQQNAGSTLPLKHIITPVNQITAQLVTPTGNMSAANMSALTQLIAAQTQQSQSQNASAVATQGIATSMVTNIVSPTVTSVSGFSPIVTQAQLLSPITMVSPGVVGSVQAGNQLGAPLLNTVSHQIPILQQPLSLQRVMKQPYMVVSLPGVVTTTTPNQSTNVPISLSHT